MTDLDKILKERGGNYGPFSGHALAAQLIKGVISEALQKNELYHAMSLEQRAILTEGLDMIAHKIGRIVNGNPFYDDSWKDIAGYATITEKFLTESRV